MNYICFGILGYGISDSDDYQILWLCQILNQMFPKVWDNVTLDSNNYQIFWVLSNSELCEPSVHCCVTCEDYSDVPSSSAESAADTDKNTHRHKRTHRIANTHKQIHTHIHVQDTNTIARRTHTHTHTHKRHTQMNQTFPRF